ncbi:MAG: hypothetical protein ACI9S8_003007 [Chlamydiales bacterium]|jgi:hypothetical protein
MAEDLPSEVQLIRDIKANKIPMPDDPLTFAGVDLTGEDLSNLDLPHANFSGASMEEVKAKSAGFGMSNLSHTELFDADLENATLSMANLEAADLRKANLRNARMRESNLSHADFTNANLQGADISLSNVEASNFNNADMREMHIRLVSGFESAQWIGVDIRNVNFAGAYRLRRFVGDQNYIQEFKSTSSYMTLIYYIWWFTSDCGRSIVRWATWICFLCLFFAGLYTLLDIDYGDYPTALSPLYFSLITLTTLGYGDAVPASTSAQILSMIEVAIGYMMLGGLLSILSNKMARRAD